MMVRERINITVDKETLFIIKRHFGDGRVQGKAIDQMARFYDNNAVSISSIKISMRKLVDKLT